MGVFTHYFVASRDQITDELVKEGPDGHVGAADLLLAKNVDPAVVLAQLGEQLTGMPFLETGSEVRPGSSPDATMPVVWELRDEVRDALAAVKPDDLMPVAQRWVTIEELAGSVTAEEAMPFLERLVGLARRGASHDKHLYCWWSL